LNGYEALQGYINVEYQLREAEMRLNQEKEAIYSKTYGDYSTNTGYLVRSSISVENAAISIVELEEIHAADFEGHYENRKLLQDALSVLSVEEREAFNHYVWDEPSSMSSDNLEKYGMQANEKLSSYIENRHLRKVVV